jgi:hypothetical protein
MAKAVRVTISNEMLVDLLGMTNTDISFYHAQIVYNTWGRPILEFVLHGENLDDIFTVDENDPIKKGQIICHKTYVESEIKPLDEATV